MVGKFEWKKFSEVNLSDSFFNSLKLDYEEFPIWFGRKATEDASVLVSSDGQWVNGFIYLKQEDDETINLVGCNLPTMPRIKIGTLKLAEHFRGQRFGEGALGVSLWYWRQSKRQEIYVTVFEKHTELINLFERFGFICVGKNKRGECVYLKSRLNIDYSDPYKAFPFIRPNFTKAGIIPVEDHFHDRLFPYSELMGQRDEIETATAGNGITKVYIGTPYTTMHYEIGDPVLVYRIHTGSGQKAYKSAVTSYCTITKVETVKQSGRQIIGLQEFIKQAGNKTVFTPDELTAIYAKNNIVMIEMVYNGYFGKGHNTNYRRIKEMGLFESHPYNTDYTKDQFISILKESNVDVQNVIIN